MLGTGPHQGEMLGDGFQDGHFPRESLLKSAVFKRGTSQESFSQVILNFFNILPRIAFLRAY